MRIGDTLDTLAANNLLLVGGALSAIFFGWLVPKALKLEEINVQEGLFFGFWRFMIRFVIPPVLLVSLVEALFIASLATGARLNGRPIRVSPVQELGEALVAAGFAEVVLTGVNTGDYGRDLRRPTNLANLLRWAPLTWDFSNWYAGAGLLTLGAVLVVALWAFYVSLAGQRLFRDSLLGG